MMGKDVLLTFVFTDLSRSCLIRDLTTLGTSCCNMYKGLHQKTELRTVLSGMVKWRVKLHTTHLFTRDPRLNTRSSTGSIRAASMLFSFSTRLSTCTFNIIYPTTTSGYSIFEIAERERMRQDWINITSHKNVYVRTTLLDLGRRYQGT
jgi:hypothetical protein